VGRLIPLQSAACRLSCVCVAILLSGPRASAQQPAYEILHAFRGLPGGAEAPLLLAGGALYGLTSVGSAGGVGAIFVGRPAAGGGLDVSFLHEFDRAEGGASHAGLVAGSDGAFYGTTPAHGTHGLGSVFRIAASGAFAVLHAFSGPDGARPQAALVLASDGNFYGTTRDGGVSGKGTVFRMTAGGVLTTLYAFTGEFGSPTTELVQAGDGALYGTTRSIEGPALGSVFRIALDGVFSTIHQFGAAEVPTTPLTVGPDGDLYGSFSVIFLTPNFFRISTAGDFSVINPLQQHGAPQQRLLLGVDGNFYGTLPGDVDAASGVAFQLTPSGAFTVLHEFTPAEGRPAAGLTAVPGGFAGVTSNGGLANHGTVFAMTGTGATSVLYQFTGNDGDTPWAPPIRAFNGALIGTTVRGGARDLGTIYRIWPGGQVDTLHAFSGGDGALPYARLVAGHDGYLYGTTVAGGCHGRGSIFRISPLFGTFSTVYCFRPSDGRVPFAPLLPASDGNLYGTTVYGGPEDLGTVFALSPAGVFTTLYAFRRPLEWNLLGFSTNPAGPLVEGPDGLLYGTTSGPIGGSLFSMTTAGGGIVRVAFSYPRVECCFQIIRGHTVTGDLTVTPAGDVYLAGQTPFGAGDLLKASLNWPGSNTQPSPFLLAAVPLGSPVASPPIEARDGLFYGVTGSSPDGTGSIYRVDLSVGGEPVTLKVLTEVEGRAPVGQLVEGPDGRLYGTATGGGPSGRGVVFRFDPD
jgi:uncharacterized repeat protein (TIGR03803 family)